MLRTVPFLVSWRYKMNTYFEKNGNFNSNSRIFEAYFTETVKTAGTLEKSLDSLLCFLSVLLRILTGATVRRIAKVSAVALSLVGFIGVIGAIEHGSLSIGMGLLLGAVLLGIEYLCLRGKPSAKGNSNT